MDQIKNIKGCNFKKEMILVIIVILCLVTSTVNSVIMPPRFHSTRSGIAPPINGTDGLIPYVYQSSHFASDDEVPYLLSINEGDSLEVMAGSKSSITINLNKVITEDVIVTVTIHSRPDLIDFDTKSDSESTTVGNRSQIFALNNEVRDIRIIYKANTCGDRIISFHSKGLAGHAEVVCKVTKKPNNITIDDSNSFISIDVYKIRALNVIISIVGWIYFLAWSLSFYFQVVLNYQRKSVVGLNFDFLALNLLGFICYSIYNFAFLFSREVQQDYYKKQAFHRIPVAYNDLFFAMHAFVLTTVTVIQCFLYERGQQKVSIPATGFIVTTMIAGAGIYIYHLFEGMTILNVVLYLSYVKLAITIIKYSPQAYMNYKRQATTGWSIHNILLDFTGGIFSIAQMFLSAYNFDDWISIFGNFTKFGLGVISISFDIVFVLQHYVLYKQVGELELSTESIPSPVISQSIRSNQPSYRQQPEAEQEEIDQQQQQPKQDQDS